MGRNAACGWLLVLAIAAVDEKEFAASNEVPGDLTGDPEYPGRDFCSFLAASLVGDFVGDRGDTWFGFLVTPALLYLS